MSTHLPLPKPLHDIFRPPPTPGVLAVFKHLDATVDAIKQLRAAGHADFTVYSPIPRHELEEALGQPTSPVRVFTLIGGMAGCAIGAWITLWMSYDWPLVVGGKPIGSVPPYVVIMFEMMVLFAGIATLLGLVILGRLPRFRPSAWFDPRFTNDRFGVAVHCPPGREGSVRDILTRSGADEVKPA